VGFFERASMRTIEMLIANKQKNNALKAIEHENEKSRGVISYGKTTVEKLFTSDEQIQNTVVTGGVNSYRSRAVIAAAGNAYNKGCPVIVIHESNRMLERMVVDLFQQTGKLEVVNKDNPFFDPFYGLSTQDISNLIVNSTTRNFPVNHAGRYYIEGVAESIRANNFDPLCNHFIECPHSRLYDLIDSLVRNSSVTESTGQKIKSLIMQGQSEIGNIDAFFQALNSEISTILINGSQNRQYSHLPVNIITTGNEGGIIILDIMSNLNTITINMLVNQIGNLVRSGRDPFVVIDSLSACGSELLTDLLKTKSVNCRYIISTDDIYAMVGADDNIFNTIVGNCGKLIVSSHSCGKACDRLADTLGYYDKQVKSQTYGGDSSNLIINVQKEHKVKPAEINYMSNNEVFVYDNSLNALCYAEITE
jgi:hypothetical protein